MVFGGNVSRFGRLLAQGIRTSNGLKGCRGGRANRPAMQMRYTAHGSESGQTLVEYALILASVALGCLAAVIFLSGSINGLFGSISNSPSGINPRRAPEPVAPPVQLPTTVQQCLYGRWHNYPQFVDEAACKQFVISGR